MDQRRARLVYSAASLSATRPDNLRITDGSCRVMARSRSALFFTSPSIPEDLSHDCNFTADAAGPMASTSRSPPSPCPASSPGRNGLPGQRPGHRRPDRDRKPDLVLLYDELIRPGHCAFRLVGYSGNRIPWGVRFGGPTAQFLKDLMLQPVPAGPRLSPRPGRRRFCLGPATRTANWTAKPGSICKCGSGLRCPSCGPDFDLMTLPLSPVTGRNWPPTLLVSAGRLHRCCSVSDVTMPA